MRHQSIAAGVQRAAKWLADAFIQLIQTITGPVIFVTVVIGIASLGNVARAGGLALRSLAYFFTMTVIALGLGLIEHVDDAYAARLPMRQRQLDFLDAQLEGEFGVQSRTEDDSKWVVWNDPVTAPSPVYLYDREAETLTEFYTSRPEFLDWFMNNSFFSYDIGEYLRTYRSQLPLDPERLALWEPVHLVHLWSQVLAADSASCVRGRAPTPTTTNPAGIRRPSSSSTVSTRPSPTSPVTLAPAIRFTPCSSWARR